MEEEIIGNDSSKVWKNIRVEIENGMNANHCTMEFKNSIPNKFFISLGNDDWDEFEAVFEFVGICRRKEK